MEHRKVDTRKRECRVCGKPGPFDILSGAGRERVVGGPYCSRHADAEVKRLTAQTEADEEEAATSKNADRRLGDHRRLG